MKKGHEERRFELLQQEMQLRLQENSMRMMELQIKYGINPFIPNASSATSNASPAINPEIVNSNQSNESANEGQSK